MKFCPKCRRNYPDDQKICEECKLSLEEINNGNDKFCDKRGNVDSLRFGDTGMIKDSSFTIDKKKTRETREQDQAQSQDQKQKVENIINVYPESKDVTKTGEKCPICRKLVDAKYFECTQCGRDYICVRHQNPYNYYCETCTPFSKKEEKSEIKDPNIKEGEKRNVAEEKVQITGKNREDINYSIRMPPYVFIFLVLAILILLIFTRYYTPSPPGSKPQPPKLDSQPVGQSEIYKGGNGNRTTMKNTPPKAPISKRPTPPTVEPDFPKNDKYIRYNAIPEDAINRINPNYQFVYYRIEGLPKKGETEESVIEYTAKAAAEANAHGAFRSSVKSEIRRTTRTKDGHLDESIVITRAEGMNLFCSVVCWEFNSKKNKAEVILQIRITDEIRDLYREITTGDKST